MIGFYENDNDLLDIARIHIENQKNTYRGILEDEYLDSLNIKDALLQWESFCKKGDRDILVYRQNGEIVGFSAVRFYIAVSGAGLLANLHVKKEAQNQGIGKKLIKASAGLLYNMGITSMQIGVIEGNVRAESIYKALGAVEKPELKVTYHKQLLWYDLSEIADVSIVPRKQFVYSDMTQLKNKEFFLFGGGEYGEIFLNLFPQLNPKAIFDNDSKKWGEDALGVKIRQPEKVESVVIASCYYQEIEEQLKTLGCKNIIKFYPWHKYKVE